MNGCVAALGIAVLCGVAAIGLGADTGILTRLSSSGTNRIEQALLNAVKPTAAPDMSEQQHDAGWKRRQAFRSDLPVEGKFPSLDGAVEWLNSPPLTNEQLRGKVVLVDFWTYSCINCIRTVPYVRAWAEKYKDQGLVVIGVHAPEFAFEKNIDNVKKAISDFQITYPVAIDNNFKIWRAFRNSYWPAHYFIDAKGQIRYQHFGEGDYDKSEKVIQDLLAEAGSLKAENNAITPDLSGAQAAPDLGNIAIGRDLYRLSAGIELCIPEGVNSDAPQNYTAAEPGLNEWGLSGNWTVGPEQATLNRAGGAITYRFRARDLHLVLGPSADGKPVRFQVTVDGRAPAESHGSDIDADGNGTVTQTRLYQMVRQAGDVKERTFEVRFLDPGVEAFAFTFG